MGAPRYQNVGVEAIPPSGTGATAGAVVMRVRSGPGCAAFQAVTNTGERANTAAVAHCGRVMGITKSALATGVAAMVDCGALAIGKYDGVIAAYNEGVAGNVITLACAGDSPPAGGVTISNIGWAYTIHFETAVSTSNDIDIAITALGAGIRVQTPGTVPGNVMLVATDTWAAAPLTGGTDGLPGPVVTHGKIRNPLWAWDMTTLPLRPIYLNGNTLSQTDPVVAHGAGFNQQIGVPVEIGAVTSDTIDVDLTTPILA